VTTNTPVETAPDVNIARDGNIAIQEEFDAAKTKNTAADYELFIARHPKHPLTKQAKAELAGLRGKNPQNN
jgi:hypothetical protein